MTIEIFHLHYSYGENEQNIAHAHTDHFYSDVIHWRRQCCVCCLCICLRSLAGKLAMLKGGTGDLRATVG